MATATEALAEAMRETGPCVVAIFARPGAGKTTLLRSLLLSWQGQRIAVDPEYQARYTRAGVHYLDGIPPDWRRMMPDGSLVPRGTLVVVDEVDRFVARGKAEAKWCLDLVNMARPWGLSVAFTARRPSAVRRDLTACARIMALGKVTEALDRDYLSEWYPKAESLRDLPPFRFHIIRL